MSKGRYYLGRVAKINLSQELLMGAILNPPIVAIGRYDWTITDVIDNRDADTPFIFGHLSKYAKEGHVKVVDESTRSQIDSSAPNLVEASAPFVYLPDFSGIAFLHVWNGIQEDVFPRRFKSIIEAAFHNFFVSVDIEPVSDYRAFTAKLKKLDILTEISATVYPPNPLFGRLWGSLKEYLEERNASELAHKEQTAKSSGIKSNLIEHMTAILNDPKYEPEKPPAIGDAIILMAADGYGRAKVIGLEDGKEVVIKTSDTQKSFLFNKNPEPQELALTTKEHLARVSKERDMDH